MAATSTNAPEGYVSLRDVFGDAIMALGARDPRVLMLDADPLLASPDEIRRMAPLETWIGGYRYYKKSEGGTLGR